MCGTFHPCQPQKLVDMKEAYHGLSKRFLKEEIEDHAASLIVVHANSCLTLEAMCFVALQM